VSFPGPAVWCRQTRRNARLHRWVLRSFRWNAKAPSAPAPLLSDFGDALGRLWGSLGGALVEPWWSLGGALVEPWGSLGVALVEPWGGLGVALGCLCGAYQQALGWPWGGLGWLCAALFPISAFSFQHFSFCPIVALGWLARPVMNHESRITNHLRLWMALPGGSRFEVRGWRFKVQSSVFSISIPNTAPLPHLPGVVWYYSGSLRVVLGVASGWPQTLTRSRYRA
jgi:hypothetical protein